MHFILLMIPFLLLAAPFHSEEKAKSISSSVVKIFTVAVKPNYYQPWQMRAQKFSTGSGVVIAGNYILTAAHVVSNGVYLEVKKSTHPKKFIAHVKWISHDADLALLQVEQESFFDDTKALELGKMPQRQEGVAVYGYPRGGNEISITQGIISRIEQTVYVHSDFDLLALQIDAAINPGNSGGPVFDQEGRVVGIAMQSLSSADNIGYLIPVPVIRHFLDDIKDARYDGFPDDGLYIQTMENPNLKMHYGMDGRSGILVTQIVPGSSCDGYLRKDDVLLEIDGVTVADDATVVMSENGRVDANHLIRSHHVGESFEAKILRKGRELTLDVPLKKLVSLICYEHEKQPQYYIFGGVVFMPLTKNYVYEWGKNWLQKAPIRFVDMMKNANSPETKNQEIVFLQNVLADRENAGYELSHAIVLEVNGVKIDSFSTLVSTIEKTKEKEVKISLQGGNIIVLDKQKASQANARLLARYGIEKSACVR